jgi:hypothetical protein
MSLTFQRAGRDGDVLSHSNVLGMICSCCSVEHSSRSCKQHGENEEQHLNFPGLVGAAQLEVDFGNWKK